MSEAVDHISPLQMRLAIHRRTIDYLEAQRARFGMFTPPYIQHQLDEARQEIGKLKRDLHALGVAVEHRASDEAVLPEVPVLPPLPDTRSLILAYQRMLVGELRFLPTNFANGNDAGFQLTDLYMPQLLTPTGPTGGVPVSVRNVLGPRARLVIEGGLGSGKSTLLRYLALACASEGVGAPLAASESGITWDGDTPLPILIPARDLIALAPAGQRQANLSAFWSSIEDMLNRNDLQALVPTMQQQLNAGCCLVLIDGLDDVVVTDNGRALAATIGRFVARYPDNRYIITCRNRAHVPTTTLSGFTSYSLHGFDEQQVDQMIEQWYTVISANLFLFDERTLHERITLLRNALHYDERLRLFVTTPFLIALSVLVHAEGRALPADRSVLYERLFDVLFDRWEHLRSDGAAPTLSEALNLPQLVTAQQRRALLLPLALAMQARPFAAGDMPQPLAAAEVEPLLREPLAAIGVDSHRAVNEIIPHLLVWCCRQGILAQPGIEPTYTMPLQPLRDYLAACALATKPDFPTYVYGLIADRRWRDAVLLATNTVARGSSAHTARELVRLLIEGGTQRPGEWLLAAEVLQEFGSNRNGPERSLLQTLQRRLLEVQQNPKHDTATRVRAGLHLGRIGDLRFSHLLPPLAQIPAGAFILGAQDGYEDEGPQQWLELPAFAVGVYPVTNAEFARFLADEPEQRAPHYWFDTRFNSPNQPVVGITWHDAVAYCGWLTRRLQVRGQVPASIVVRLPSEYEWEKAASWDRRKQLKYRHPWGDEWQPDRANTVEGRGPWVTAPVGSYPLGVSPYGLFDTIGNVWEWTASTYASYPGTLLPFVEPGSYALRGSSCASLCNHARTTYRSRLPAEYWRYHLGFRIVIGRPLPPEQHDG